MLGRLSLVTMVGSFAAACSSNGSQTLFSDGFDTYPSSHWIQTSGAAPTLDPNVGSPAPSLALGTDDTYFQTALVGPFDTPGTTFSMDVSFDSPTSTGRACLMLFVQGHEGTNFGLNLETNGANFSDGLGPGCTFAFQSSIVSAATPGFHTLSLEFDDSGMATARFDGSQIGKASWSQQGVMMRLDGQVVHLDNARITTN